MLVLVQADIGAQRGASLRATDLWTGEVATHAGSLSARVEPHDCAVFRLAPA